MLAHNSVEIGLVQQEAVMCGGATVPSVAALLLAEVLYTHNTSSWPSRPPENSFQEVDLEKITSA